MNFDCMFRIRSVTIKSVPDFDICCSVHFCDTGKFCCQQMHTLYFVFVRHFTSLPTCFDPCGSSSGHLIHGHLQVIIIPYIKSIIVCG
jgi:hypothetical protein